MRKYIIILAIAILSLCSCNPEAVFDKTGTKIDITNVKTLASYVKVDLDLVEEDSYYFCGIIADSLYDDNLSAMRFMQLQLDYAYKEYINWRYDLLENNADYVASFASHCLQYGDDSHYFMNLSQQTDYIVYAFCVNADTNQPVGKLYTQEVTTDEFRPVDMTFQFKFENRDEGPYITVIPSNDNDPYIWDFDDLEDMINTAGDTLSARSYAYTKINYYREFGFDEELRTTGFDTYNCYDDLEEGHKYMLVAAGFDGDFTTEPAYLIFSYPFTDKELNIQIKGPND